MIFKTELIVTLSANDTMKESRFRYLARTFDFLNQILHRRTINISDNNRINEQIKKLKLAVGEFESVTGIRLNIEEMI